MGKSKAIFGAAVCAASIVSVGASAFAGEVTGSGKGGPAGDGVTGAYTNGNSPCLFSGLEDDPVVPGTVQNWGHVKDSAGGGGANDVESWDWGCNAHDFGLKPD